MGSGVYQVIHSVLLNQFGLSELLDFFPRKDTATIPFSKSCMWHPLLHKHNISKLSLKTIIFNTYVQLTYKSYGYFHVALVHSTFLLNCTGFCFHTNRNYLVVKKISRFTAVASLWSAAIVCLPELHNSLFNSLLDGSKLWLAINLWKMYIHYCSQCYGDL